jgi:hypothetical protein
MHIALGRCGSSVVFLLILLCGFFLKLRSAFAQKFILLFGKVLVLTKALVSTILTENFMFC